jgi:BMFP domain-containing protein YqiC
MSVWAPISEEIMRGVREDSPELDRQLRAAALGLARSIMQSESEAIERVPQLEQLVDSQAAELEQAGRREEALRRRIEELEARESGATSPAPIAEASAPDAPRRRRQQTRKAA